jgi:hypothetical protein
MLKVSETYVIGVDITNDDESVIMISRHTGSGLECVNTITGKDAEELYKTLTNK